LGHGLALGLALATTPLAAQDLTPPEAALLPRLIDSTCIDLVEEHNGCEQVIVLASETEADRADLIVLTDWRTDPASAPLLIARSIAFNGSMWGMATELEQAANGSLRLTSQQTGIGRFPWYQTLTIAYRDEVFVLAGFSYSTYDRMAGHRMSCDVNLITGDYAVEASLYDMETERHTTVLDETGQIEPMVLDAANLGTNAPFPSPCEAGMVAVDEY
jgi:hypothetical protein